MLTQTIRNTFRSWRRTPVLAVTALLTLSVGVGVNAAVFSVVHAVLFRPLPYPAPERLVEMFEHSPASNTSARASLLDYLSWAERTKSLEAIAAFNGASFNVTGDAEAERVAGTQVTASLTDVLSVAPLAGRPLLPEDERPDARRVALVARSYWLRRFGGDPSVIGRTVTLNGERHEIVGVVPEAFREVGRSQISAVASPQIFVPLTIDSERENRGNRVLRVVGRLRPGVSIEQAREEMNIISAGLAREFPETNAVWSGIRVESVSDSMLDEGVRPSLLMLLGAVAVVMLIACANVSNLVLAKAIGRQRELALRTAIGAGPGRLLRQVLTESVCLAAVSGLIGIYVSLIAVEALRSLLPPTLPRIDEVRVDAVVLGFGLLVSLLSGILFGILPAIRVSRVDPLDALVRNGRGLSAGASRSLLRQALVAVQVALATTLLAGAGLLLQSFVRLHQVPLGFEAEGVLTARLSLPRTTYPDAVRIRNFYRQLVEVLDEKPDVRAAAIATSAPFGSGVRRTVTVGAGRASGASSSRTAAEHIVSDDYFRTLAIPLLAGRTFDHDDRPGSPPVVIVSEALSQQLWPSVNPIGQQLERDGRLHEVVGVAGDVRGSDVSGARGGGLDRQPHPAIYLSAMEFPQATMTLLLRTTGEPTTLVATLRAAIRDLDPALPADQVRAHNDWLAEAAAQPRFTTLLAGMFAGMAVFLAAVGIYGVVVYTAGQRGQEIGLRMALGATRGQILAMIVRDGLTSALVGMLIGCVGAFLLNRLAANLFFEVRYDDLPTFASVAVLLGFVAFVACYVPARRAARVDPLVAIRFE